MTSREVVGTDRGERTTVAADGRPHRIDDPRLTRATIGDPCHAPIVARLRHLADRRLREVIRGGLDDPRVSPSTIRSRQGSPEAAHAKGPWGCAAPSLSARSMSSSDATPSAAANRASSRIAPRIRRTTASRPSAVADSTRRPPAAPPVDPWRDRRSRVRSCGRGVRHRPAAAGSVTGGVARGRPETLPDRRRGGVRHVDAREVHQLERAHREAGAAHRAHRSSRRSPRPSPGSAAPRW